MLKTRRDTMKLLEAIAEDREALTIYRREPVSIAAL